MENTYIKSKFIAFLATIMGLVVSCNEPDEFEILNSYKPGTTATITDLDPSFFDIFNLNTSAVSFKVDLVGQEATSVEVYKQYKGGERIPVGTYTSFPADITITAEEAVAGTGVALESLAVGDLFNIYFDITQANGTVTTAHRVVPVNIACGSNLAGTYSTKTSGSSTDGGPTENPVTDFEYQVTLTATPVNGVYTISDFSGGVYELWYDIYGIAGDSPGTIQDVCNAISFTNTSEPFGTAVTGTGAVDPDTGIITLSGGNGYGDVWTIVMTPN